MEPELCEGNGDVESGKRGELPTLIHLKIFAATFILEITNGLTEKRLLST